MTEHCLFHFGRPLEWPELAELQRTSNCEEREMLDAYVAGIDTELSRWVMVRIRPLGAPSLYYYSAIQEDRLRSAFTFSEAREYALSVKISQVSLGNIAADLNNGQAEWRSTRNRPTT